MFPQVSVRTRLLGWVLLVAIGLPAQAARWQTLFGGRDTSAWRGYRQESFPARGWVVEHGALRVVKGGGGGDLVTREQYGDFELRFEWKVSAGANSGVLYRVSEAAGAPYETGPEYQVLDDARHADGRNPKTSAAALYALRAANERKALKPVGGWNRARIVVRANRAEHWLNGKQVVAYEWDSPALAALIAESKFRAWPGFARQARGHVCLQDHGDDVWFRRIKIRRLDGGKGRP
jgi:hypothetical protein